MDFASDAAFSATAAVHVAARIEADALRVFEVVRDGGVALIPLDVAYALVARTAEAVRRVYGAKGREFNKPMGLVGGLPAHQALHVLDARRQAMVHAIVVEHDLPLSVVASYREGHAYLAGLDPFVLAQSTQAGTLNLLLNAGALRTRLAQLCWAHGVAMTGTSANLSLSGSRFSVATVDAAIVAACDLVIDHGPSRYENREGKSSTIIDFANLRLLRHGVCGSAILQVLQSQFGVTLR
jgi:tRNA A37 threonylcarbamoyladenosine synthetase subunit TsaC/SUA5/YrdC